MLEVQPSRIVIADQADRLYDALVDEGRALQSLQDVLERQRQSVADNDRHAIEESVHAIGRTLLTLDEARRRREALVAYVTGRSDLPLSELPEAFDEPLPHRILEAHRAVRDLALNLRREVIINKHIIDRTLQIGDRFLQRLFTETEVAPNYAADAGADTAPGGVIVNRQA